ncbi:MAG: pectinesterase family protein [Clostridia bacterium]|nr:pectinesterase family protein [Clostridia bacterium]
MTKIYVTPDDDLQKILDGITAPSTIYLAKGVYNQKIKISCSNVKIVGEERETTVISYGDYARKIHADGKEYNTFRTYTVCVTGENVKLENFTIENYNTSPSQVGQCVALSVNAKRFLAYKMTLKSMQDTLFVAPFPDDLVVRYRGFIPEDELYMEGGSLHLFKNCRICGTVDFIFGCAEAYFTGCEIVSLDDVRDISYIAAPAHSLKQKYGFTFANCNITSGGAVDGGTFLARPWRDFGKCCFVNCKAGSHLHPEMFDKWNDTERNKTARFYYGGLKTAEPVAPVEWSHELSAAEIKKLLARCAEVEKSYGFDVIPRALLRTVKK